MPGGTSHTSSLPYGCGHPTPAGMPQDRCSPDSWRSGVPALSHRPTARFKYRPDCLAHLSPSLQMFVVTAQLLSDLAQLRPGASDAVSKSQKYVALA